MRPSNLNFNSLTFVFFWVLITSVTPISVTAQNSVSGRITDSDTGEPLPYVNVFFANSTFGASTNGNGEFQFSGFPSGKYNLTFTYVGYVSVQQQMAFDGNTHLEVNKAMELESILLKEILVKPDTINWRQNFETFKYHFLGNTAIARKCLITNPKSVFLYFDKLDGTLVAHAREPIIIENQGTGYRIKYYLEKFEFQSKKGVFTIRGIPQFEEMKPRNERERKGWIRQRDKIFDGSLNHFMRAWYAQDFQGSGFHVARVNRVSNQARPTDEFLNERIAYWQKQVNESRKSQRKANALTEKPRKANDSLRYFKRLYELPKETDSLVKEFLSGKEFFDPIDTSIMKYTGILFVEHEELEELEYARKVGRPDDLGRRHSLVHVLKPLRIYSNGYYEDIGSVFLENYWSWSEKIATQLPMDYVHRNK